MTNKPTPETTEEAVGEKEKEAVVNSSSEDKQGNRIPLAIVLAGALIALAVISVGSIKEDNQPAVIESARVVVTRSENRLVYGNLEASTTIVEFSDFRCGFCARVHPTLTQIVDESDGAINWEYRHLPILSTESTNAAVASECVARLAGNEAFWPFANAIFANQSSLDSALYLSEALKLGIDEVSFTTCLEDETVIGQVEVDASVAQSMGGRGTPYSVVVHSDGLIQPISGALPLNEWYRLIDIYRQ